MANMQNKQIFYLLPILFSKDVHSLGPLDFLCENCSGDNPSNYIYIVISFGLLLFGWVEWGSKSIKLIYLPSLIGSLIIFPFVNLKTSLILTLPILGLIIGWCVILIGTIFFNYEYFDENKEKSKNRLMNKDCPGQIEVSNENLKKQKNNDIDDIKNNNNASKKLLNDYVMDNSSIQNEHEEMMEQKRLSKEIKKLVLYDELKETKRKKL